MMSKTVPYGGLTEAPALPHALLQYLLYLIYWECPHPGMFIALYSTIHSIMRVHAMEDNLTCVQAHAPRHDQTLRTHEAQTHLSPMLRIFPS